MNDSNILKAYQLAKEYLAQWQVDPEAALAKLEGISLSIHCWQGDDVAGFERPDAALSDGGIQVTGNYPGKARTIGELKQDLEKVFSLIPGQHRLNLHAIYGDFSGKVVERNEIRPEHFNTWVDWALQNNLKLDFNATCFSHPKAESGFTLSNKDNAIRNFWLDHVQQCREISAYMGNKLNSPVVHNLWIPDGSKDIPADRWTPRKLLRQSLDEIYAKEYAKEYMLDSVESKLFGIGSESYVVGSHEFYMGYALSRDKMLCLDMGHFHPTEYVADKISAILQFCDQLLLHISRGVRWDSDHVVILNDDLLALALEIVRGDILDKIHFGLDFFDASINRIGAWIIGARATLKALLFAMVQPNKKLIEFENQNQNFERLALMDEMKMIPLGALWDYYCLKNNVPTGASWLKEVQKYEQTVLAKRV